MTWAVLDLETTTSTLHGRKASPFHPDNWVVMSGWCTKENQMPVGTRYLKGTQDWLTDDFLKLLEGHTLLVGVNIKFDLLHILKDERALVGWMSWVANGGNVWDCQLAEYLLQGCAQQAHMLSMNDMAAYYDEDTKVDEVKLLWEAGVPTEEIDPDLLSRYLLGEDLNNPATGEVTGRREGDIGTTRNIFFKQVKQAQAMGQSRSIMLNMGSLLCSIEMERNGMYVDKEKGLALAAELRTKLAAAKDELEQYLPEGLPFKFTWSNRYHLSPLIFGGSVNYDSYEWDLKDGGTADTKPTDGNGVYSQKDEVHYVLEDGTTMECLWWDHCLWTEWGGGPPSGKERVTFKGGKNAGECKTKKVKVNDLTKPKGRAVKRPFAFPGFTVPEKEWASSTEGLYSVASEVIDSLVLNTTIPFLKVLGSVFSMSKDLGTYFIVTDESTGISKGMLTLVGDDNLVHHSINHTSTVTGRFSASKPNLQNIPKGNKSAAKQMFVSRFSGGSIVQSDFSSLEVYVQAILTGCKQLIADLRDGLDMHCVRLASKEHMDYAEVLKLCKGWKETNADGTVIEHASVEEWDYKRTGAKVFSFQRAYGAGNPTIAKATGMPLEEVEALSAAEDARYPEIAKHFDKLGDRIMENAKPTSQFIPHPDNPAVRVQLRVSRVATPDGKLYTYLSKPSMGWQLKRGITSTFSPTERMNYSVQGMGAEVMKAAMWLLVREFYRNRNWGGLALLVNTVHDAAYADVQPDLLHEVAPIVHACMEAASDFFAYFFKWDIPLPVPSDTVHGADMGDENKLQSAEFKAAAKKHREFCRQHYMCGFTPSYIN